MTAADPLALLAQLLAYAHAADRAQQFARAADGPLGKDHRTTLQKV